jgi:cellulose synthase/poly-beta-1,6-N-acetylglucosamine synthase-like glycosyltransferase
MGPAHEAGGAAQANRLAEYPLAVVVDVILLALAALLAVPSAVLAAEVGASLLGRRRKPRPADPTARPSVGVVIPAHNEQGVLARTLGSLLPQLNPADRVVVVADNCEDDTAGVARAAGAACVERTDARRRGKGYALDAGVRALVGQPPEIVVFTDADVAVREGALEELVRQVQRTGRPAQGEYLMETPAKARSVDLVSRFAFTLKNKVRPLGLWRMGLPCPLFGAGMAFPWKTISQAPLATGDLVEDMRLGIDLCRQGQAPLFCPDAQFRGVLPGDLIDADAQRRRWEHGHLSVIRDIPLLLASGIRRFDGRTIAMCLDHLVQPLTVLCAELVIVLIAATAWWLTRGGTISAAAAIVAAGGVAGMAFSLLVAWGAHMRGQIPPKALLGLPRYLVSRGRNQAGWLFRRQRDWVRTPRAKEPGGPPDASGGAAGSAANAVSGSSDKGDKGVSPTAPVRPASTTGVGQPRTELAASHR